VLTSLNLNNSKKIRTRIKHIFENCKLEREGSKEFELKKNGLEVQTVIPLSEFYIPRIKSYLDFFKARKPTQPTSSDYQKLIQLKEHE